MQPDSVNVSSTSLKELHARILVCPNCSLSATRTRAVPGEGAENASIFIIGEAPGQNEDQQGRPFVGQAGKFLDELLSIAGLKRTEVFITNIVKCRPPSNRDPLPGEIQACTKYLDHQMKLINAKIIITLGRYSLARFFPNEIISKIHGKAIRLENRVCIAMYHPAAALHQPNLRKAIEDDFRKIPEMLKGKQEQTRTESKAEQLGFKL